jgi:hypothetical protein
MQTARMFDRYVIARDKNVLRVNFERSTDPPNPQFPGAGALRSACVYQVDAAFRRPWFWKERTQAKRLPDNQHASGPIGQRPIRHRGFTMEEEMIRGLSAVLVSGTFMFSLSSTLLLLAAGQTVLAPIHKTGRCFLPGTSQRSHLTFTEMKCPR